MATELLINLVSQFTGKGFIEAEKSVNKLEKKVKSLSKTLGISLAAGAALKFSKIYVKAFAEDEKATLQLTKAVQNLGIGFASPSINKYIENLEKTAAISRTELRPAFQDLLTTTGSLTKAQDILNKSIIISRGSGVALGTVTEDLTKAYLGSTKGLEKYKTGFTGAELAAKSFSENLEILLTLNKGAADDYFTTTAYKLELLALAGESAKITIGEGLVEGLGNFAGSGEASDAQFVIDNLATGFANLFKLVGAVGGVFTEPLRLFGIDQIYDRPETVTSKQTEFTKKQKEIIAKLDAAAAKRAKALADLAKKQANAEILKTKEKEKQAKLDKAALALGKGEDVFDLDKIQVQAALLAKQDEINKLGVNATDQQKLQLANDLTRLSIKQTMAQLEDAIAAKDVEAATRLAKKLNIDLAILGALQGQQFKLQDINDILEKFKPKQLIDIDNLDQALLLLGKMAGLKITPSTTTTPTTTPITTPTTTPITTPTTTPITTPTTTPITTPITTSTTTPITTPTTTTTPTTPNTITTIIDNAVAAIASSEFAGTSLGNSANILSSARLTAQLDQIMAGFAETNQLAADRYTAQLEQITARNTLTNNLAADRYTAMQNYYVTVNAGVVGSEDTIAQAVQKAILDLERKGDPLRYTGGL